MEDWLTRYRGGDEDAVWRELSAVDLRDADARTLEEARAVCAEMAQRALGNVQAVIGRLTGQGYRFHTNDDRREPVRPHVAAGSRSEPILDWLAGRFGSVPLTLSAWMRTVGDVWLVGTHPDWSDADAADPLASSPPAGSTPATR